MRWLSAMMGVMNPIQIVGSTLHWLGDDLLVVCSDDPYAQDTEASIDENNDTTSPSY